MKKIKLILFDIDNTLVYGNDANKYYQQYGTLLEETLSGVMNITLEEAKKIADENRRRFDGRGEKAFEVYDLNMTIWNQAICTLDTYPYLKPNPKVQEVLGTLKKAGYILGAITDGPTRQAYKILEATNINRNLFSEFIGWEQGEKMPKGGSSDVYKRIISKYKFHASEVLMVGDSISVDIIPAHACGMNVFHISNDDATRFPTIVSVEKLIDNINIYENNTK